MQARFPKGGPNLVSLKQGEGVEKKPAVQKTDATKKPEATKLESKTQFTAPAAHATVEKPGTQAHVIPLTARAKADPLLGAKETPARVSEKLPTPRRPPGYGPRELWQEIIVMGTGHEAARALIGKTELVDKLKSIGFDVSVATEWRTFFDGIDRVSTERGKPNPSAKGRAEFADWVVVQLGGASAGMWKGAAA